MDSSQPLPGATTNLILCLFGDLDRFRNSISKKHEVKNGLLSLLIRESTVIAVFAQIRCWPELDCSLLQDLNNAGSLFQERKTENKIGFSVYVPLYSS